MSILPRQHFTTKDGQETGAAPAVRVGCQGFGSCFCRGRRQVFARAYPVQVLYSVRPPPSAASSCPRPPSQACRAKRRYLLKHPDADWVDVPELPKAAVELLTRDFVRCTSRVVQCQSSADGETSKLLLELQDGLQVEAVIMRYDTTGASAAERRGTSCAAVLMYGWWQVHKSSL